MKPIITTLVSILIISSYCWGQPVMRSLDDAKKIKENEKTYINHPLSDLLRDIQPAITAVLASPSSDNNVRLGSLTFRFQDTATMQKLRNRGKQPLSIIVFVKEPFEWNFKNRSADKKFSWTLEDKERLKNLTVVGLRVVY